MDSDIRFMKMALREAKRGFGATSPNPRVGAVMVAQGRVMARGYHRSFGALHAEVECIQRLPRGQANGATLYVNLEPCCHYGKTPPCAEAIIQSGIKRVVYGIQDPNPMVNGQGLAAMAAAGLEVVGPILEEDAREINRGYLKFRSTARPWVTLKWAQSLDGRIAAATGDARWISCEESLKLAHRLRAQHDAVLIGINTALRDDPQLTVRSVRGHNPRRVILDALLRLSPDAALFQVKAPVCVFTRPYPPSENSQRLQEKGAEIIWIPQIGKDELDLGIMLDELARRGILYLLVEGGSHVLGSFVRQRLFDEIIVVTAPMLLGADAIPSISSLGLVRVAEGVKLNLRKTKFIGHDLAFWLRPTV